MENFNLEKAQAFQKETLEKVEKIYKSLKDDVSDYYWDRVPQSEEEATKNEEEMYKYLKIAYDDINKILNAEDKDLSY